MTKTTGTIDLTFPKAMPAGNMTRRVALRATSPCGKCGEPVSKVWPIDGPIDLIVLKCSCGATTQTDGLRSIIAEGFRNHRRLVERN